jgi:hypothetical protein
VGWVQLLVIKVGVRGGVNPHRRSIELGDNLGFFLLACINNGVNLNSSYGALLPSRTSMGVLKGNVPVHLHDDFLLATLLPVGGALTEGLRQESPTHLPGLKFRL